MAELTKTTDNKKGDFSTMLRRGVIIGIITAGAIIATPPNKTNVNKEHALTAHNQIAITHIKKGNSLSSSFDGVCILGLITTGITFGLYKLGRKLDKIDD